MYYIGVVIYFMQMQMRRRTIGNDAQFTSQKRRSKFHVKQRLETRMTLKVTPVMLRRMYARLRCPRTVMVTVLVIGNSRRWHVRSATSPPTSDLLYCATSARIHDTSHRRRRRKRTMTWTSTLKRKTSDQRRRLREIVANCSVSTVAFSSRRPATTGHTAVSTAREEVDAMLTTYLEEMTKTQRQFADVDGHLAVEVASLTSLTLGLTVSDHRRTYVPRCFRRLWRRCRRRLD